MLVGRLDADILSIYIIDVGCHYATAASPGVSYSVAILEAAGSSIVKTKYTACQCPDAEMVSDIASIILVNWKAPSPDKARES